MRRLAGAAAVAATMAVVAGCGPGSPGQRELDGACDDRLGRPLKAKDLVAAFEAEGFTMHSLASSFYCEPSNFGGAGVAVADVSNQRSVTEDHDIVDREGWVTCLVSRDGGEGPYELAADLDRGPDSPIFSGTKAVFDLANVACSHYPPEADAKAWQARAYAGMKRLQRRLAAQG